MFRRLKRILIGELVVGRSKPRWHWSSNRDFLGPRAFSPPPCFECVVVQSQVQLQLHNSSHNPITGQFNDCMTVYTLLHIHYMSYSWQDSLPYSYMCIISCKYCRTALSICRLSLIISMQCRQNTFLLNGATLAPPSAILHLVHLYLHTLHIYSLYNLYILQIYTSAYTAYILSFSSRLRQ